MRVTRSGLAVCAVLLIFHSTAARTRAVVLADTQGDFSTAAQGTNGFQYGVYTGTNAIVEGGGVVFSTANFSAVSTGNGPTWLGNESLSTPGLWNFGQHPGVDSRNPAVRRYTVGSSGEPSYTGPVQIAGQFFDLDGGLTGGFITVDGVNQFNQAVPNTSNATGTAPFNFQINVHPGSTIDFGVTAGADSFSDSTGLIATIDQVPEPGVALVTVALLFLRRRPRG